MEEYYFDAKQEVENLTNWIKKWFEKNGPASNAVVNISGGKDTAIVASLCVRALGNNRVIGVLMPYSENDGSILDSKEIVNYLNIKHYSYDIYEEVKAIKDAIKNTTSRWSLQANINLQSRIRTVILYALSQSIDGRVANCNTLSENYIGYYTRFGDSAGDFSPLAKYTNTEVLEIGKVLGISNKILNKSPEDGVSGKIDEESFGFSYTILDKYIRFNTIDNKEIKDKIDSLHEKNLFKTQPLDCFVPDFKKKIVPVSNNQQNNKKKNKNQNIEKQSENNINGPIELEVQVEIKEENKEESNS